MKINGNQVVTGMYVYDDKIEYTVNDFVVSDGVIYVCIKDAIGKNPETNSEHFTIYLGDRDRSIHSLSEYLEFLETSEGENKYLSVGMLQVIMSSYLLGPTGKGIIGDYIYYDTSKNFEVSLRVSDPSGIFTNPEDILSQIMFHPDINHALLRVSRYLPEINGYVGSQGISEYSGLDQKSVILRQYTYLQEDTEDRIRLQELIDPIEGVIWYRSGVLDSTQPFSMDTWKCSVTSDTKALKSKVEGIIGVYTSRLKVLNSLESHLKSNFRYRRIDLPGHTTTISIEGQSPEVTLTVSEKLSSGYLRNYETSFNLGDLLDGNIPSYLVGDKYRLDTTLSGDGYVISLIDIATNTTPGNSWFSGAYYKEYYGIS